MLYIFYKVYLLIKVTEANCLIVIISQHLNYSHAENCTPLHTPRCRGVIYRRNPT